MMNEDSGDLMLQTASSGHNLTLTTEVTSEITTEAEHADFYRTSQFVTGIIIYPIICIPGFIANILTLIVLSRRNMLTSTNAFLSALAVSDAIKLGNDIIYFLVLVLFRTNPVAANRAYGHVYPYAHFVFNASACVSSWLTVSVAVERFIMVCLATRARSLCSRPRAIITSSFVFVVMSTIAIPSALRYRTIQTFDNQSNTTGYDIILTPLWENGTFVRSYTWILNLLRCIIPLFILIVLNFCIINALRKSRANKKHASRNRVTFMLIMVIVVFLVGITPDAIMSTFLGFGYHEANLLVKGIREFTDTLIAVSAAVNFIIYCVCNQNFRQTFAVVFCCKPHSRKIAQIDETQYRRLSEASARPERESKNGSVKTGSIKNGSVKSGNPARREPLVTAL